MDVRELLRVAADEVAAADLPDDLRPTGFRFVLERLGTEERSTVASPPGGTPGDKTDVLGLISQSLRIEREAVAEVFEVDAEGVRLIIAASVLPKQKAAAMREVALLITAARQGAGLDDAWTSQEVIREQCRDFGVLDSANFATEIGRMASVFGFKGSGRSRQVRVNRRGLEEAGALARRYAGVN